MSVRYTHRCPARTRASRSGWSTTAGRPPGDARNRRTRARPAGARRRGWFAPAARRGTLRRRLRRCGSHRTRHRSRGGSRRARPARGAARRRSAGGCAVATSSSGTSRSTANSLPSSCTSRKYSSRTAPVPGCDPRASAMISSSGIRFRNGTRVPGVHAGRAARERLHPRHDAHRERASARRALAPAPPWSRRGDSRCWHDRWPSKWYLPSSGKNSIVNRNFARSRSRKIRRISAVVELAVKHVGLAAELGRRVRVRVADERDLVQLRQAPVHRRIAAEAGLRRGDVLRLVPEALRERVEPGVAPVQREPRRPHVGGNDHALRARSPSRTRQACRSAATASAGRRPSGCRTGRAPR